MIRKQSYLWVDGLFLMQKQVVSENMVKVTFVVLCITGEGL